MPFTLQTLDHSYYWKVEKLSYHLFVTASSPSNSNDPDDYKFSIVNGALFSIGCSAYVGPDSSALLKASNQNETPMSTNRDGNNNSIAIQFAVDDTMLYVLAQPSGWLQVCSTSPQFFLQKNI